MAGMNHTSELRSSPHQGGQLRAIAWLRWRLFVNALRSTRGKMELVSQIIVGIAFAIGGFGGALGMGIAAYWMISAARPMLLALLFWFVTIFWQLFPIMATAFTNNPDSSDLLRFPLSYRAYFLVRLAYGSFDPATALGSLWTFGIFVGVIFAKTSLLPWTLLVLLAFTAFNLLFMQMVFAWVERWLAQRRTREVLGILFVLLMLSFQLIGPLTGYFGRRAGPGVRRFVEVLASVQGIFPPGLAADAIAQGLYSEFRIAFTSFGLLCAFLLIIVYFLHVRLRAQYRGENLSEVAAVSARPKDRSLRLGWELPGFSAPVAAVFEKEFRYLSRSGPMLLTLIMPLFVLVVFRLGPMSTGHHSRAFLAHARYGISGGSRLHAAHAHQSRLQQLWRRRRRHSVFLRVAGALPRNCAGEKSYPCEHSGRGNADHVDRRELSLWPPQARRRHRNAGRPALRRAAELFRRQFALALLAEEIGFLQVRPPTRRTSHSAG